MTDKRETVELSLVIPVYNGSRTIGPLVEHIQTIFATKPFDIILVNEGSEDESEMVCSELAEKFPQTVAFIHLSRNFGEHSAVLAGLSHARGQYVAVLDDDGQNLASAFHIIGGMFAAVSPDGDANHALLIAAQTR